MSPKRITIDDLAMMVQKGFTEVHEYLKAIEKRLGIMERRLGIVEHQMATKEDLEILESRLMYRFERRFEPLEDDLRNRKRLID